VVMSEPNEPKKEQISADELTLFAFGELPADRASAVEDAIRQDPHTQAIVASMRRLAGLASQDAEGPTHETLAATQATIRLAAARQAWRRRARIVAAVGSAAAVAVIALVIARRPPPRPQAPTVAQAPQTPGSQPDVVALSLADREIIRKTLVRIRRQRVWDDPLDDQTARLRRRVEALRFHSSRVGPTPRRYQLLRRRIDRLSDEVEPPSRTSQPAGSSRRPAPTKEADHA